MHEYAMEIWYKDPSGDMKSMPHVVIADNAEKAEMLARKYSTVEVDHVKHINMKEL